MSKSIYTRAAQKPPKYISIHRTIFLHLFTPRLPRLLLTTPIKCIFHLFPTPKIQPTAQKYNPKVKSTISPKDTISLPLQAIEYIKPLRELISVGILAELAQAIGPVLDVAARCLNKRLCVGLTSFSRWGSEAGEFAGGANDGTAVSGYGEKAGEEVAERGKIVHPGSPKLTHCISESDSSG